MIKINALSYTYSKRSPYEFNALKDINLQINEGEFFGIIGATGSGKSTLIAHLNGLKRVQGNATIEVDTNLLTKKKLNRKKTIALREAVQMVFQYPEYQLFADSVFKDVSFGPKNLKIPKEEIAQRVKNAIEMVGLDFDTIKDRSPFELSGGQKRRVAIAGVLAMHPKILVVDEPTSGLDPKGKKEILALFRNLQKSTCPTIIMVSHNMDEIAENCDRVAVMYKGSLATVRPPKDLFSDYDFCKAHNIDLPKVTKFAKLLGLRGDIVTRDELAQCIIMNYERCFSRTILC